MIGYRETGGGVEITGDGCAVCANWKLYGTEARDDNGHAPTCCFRQREEDEGMPREPKRPNKRFKAAQETVETAPEVENEPEYQRCDGTRADGGQCKRVGNTEVDGKFFCKQHAG